MSEATTPFLSTKERADNDGFSAQRLGVGSDNTTPANPPPTDRVWGLAFKLNVCFTLFSALWYGTAGFHALNNGWGLVGGDTRRLATGGSGFGGPAFVFVGVVCIGWAVAWGMLHVVIKFSKEILQVAYLGSAGVAGVAAVSALTNGHWIVWIVPAMLSAWCVRTFFKHQSRIRFSSANLKVAALAVKSMPWTFRVALLMGAVQVVWVLVWVIAAGGSIASSQVVIGPDGTVYSSFNCHSVRLKDGFSCSCGGETIIYSSACPVEGPNLLLCFFWLCSLLWGAGVIQAVVTAAVTGSVASWWFSPGDESPVRGALYRATHGSFGSLCKAVAVITTVRFVLLVVRRINIYLCCFNFILQRLRGVVDYVLSYAICFISIYGLSFSEAGRRVAELFRDNGVTTIANDIIVDVGLSALVVAVTACYVVAASTLLRLVASAFGSPSDTSFVEEVYWIVIISYVLVAIVVGTTVGVLRSSFKAVFVCFVQDSEALATNHGRQIYNELSSAWREVKVGCPEMRVARDKDDDSDGIQEV